MPFSNTHLPSSPVSFPLAHWFAALTLAAILAGCSERPAPAVSNPHDLSDDATTLRGDLPPRGRSLFDQLTMVRDGDGYRQVIPYPYQELRRLIESQTAAPTLVTMFPRGRSLQRNAAREAPFRYPRLVMAAASGTKPTPDNWGLLLQDRLYIGYVESTNQLEVISFNDADGRFEFQLVENYGPTGADVRYASREFCQSCHQNQAPIFSVAPWDETTANPKIQEQVARAMGTTSYLGVPIKQFRNTPNEIDNSTDRANILVRDQQLWAQGCDAGEALLTSRCRELSLVLGLEYALTGAFDYTLYAELSALYGRAWQLRLPAGLPVPTPNIPNFDPFADFVGRRDTSFLDHLGVSVRDQLARIATDSDIPPEAEPLRERKVPLETWQHDSADSARLIYALAGLFGEADVALLRPLLTANGRSVRTQVAAMSAQDPGLFGAPTFERCRLLQAVARAAAAPAAACGLTAGLTLPPARATGTAVTSDDARLAPFLTYCSACHASGPLAFLAGTSSAEILANLAQNKDEHIRRLSWEAPDARQTMPPPQSSQRLQLTADPAARQAMIRILQGL